MIINNYLESYNRLQNLMSSVLNKPASVEMP